MLKRTLLVAAVTVGFALPAYAEQAYFELHFKFPEELRFGNQFQGRKISSSGISNIQLQLFTLDGRNIKAIRNTGTGRRDEYFRCGASGHEATCTATFNLSRGIYTLNGGHDASMTYYHSDGSGKRSTRNVVIDYKGKAIFSQSRDLSFRGQMPSGKGCLFDRICEPFHTFSVKRRR